MNEELEKKEKFEVEDEKQKGQEEQEGLETLEETAEKEETYEEPSWEETHEDVPDVVDGGEQETEESEQIEEVQEKMLTQSQVNELVGRARQEGRMSAIKEMIERYGVGDESELDDVFGRGQAYDSLNDDFVNTNRLYGEVMAENALLKSHVDVNRWDDIKLILGGKGLEITEENIEALLPSHPEWKSGLGDFETQNAEVGGEVLDNGQQQKPSVLQKLGEDISPKVEEEDEEEKVRKWYGI